MSDTWCPLCNQPVTPKPAPRMLRATQRHTLEILAELIMANGSPPTLQQLAIKLGLKSPASAMRRLQALQKLGCVAGVGRSLRLLVLPPSLQPQQTPQKPLQESLLKILCSEPAGIAAKAENASSGHSGRSGSGLLSSCLPSSDTQPGPIENCKNVAATSETAQRFADAQSLATQLYESLKARDALPADKHFFIRQVRIAERSLLIQRPLKDWETCLEWALHDSFWADRLVSLRQLGSVWSQFARRKGGSTPPPTPSSHSPQRPRLIDVPEDWGDGS